MLLASADPAARPLIDPAYFTDEADLGVLIAGVRMAREMAAESDTPGPPPRSVTSLAVGGGTMPLRYAPSLVGTRYALTAPADPDAPLAAGGASRRVVA